MKIVIEAEDRNSAEDGESGPKVEIVLTEIGSSAWVRLDVGGRSYDIDYREFWDAARAVCVRGLD